MKLATVLSGQAFIFRSLKEVLAKANELKSGDVLAGVAASSDLERIAAKEVLSQLLLSDLRNHPVVPYEEDEVTRINQDGIDETVYQRIKNWTVAELREYILSHETTEDDIHLLSKGLTSEMVAAVCKLMTNMDLVYGASKVRVPAHCNTTIGLRGTLATRLQPNHSTDNVEGITPNSRSSSLTALERLGWETWSSADARVILLYLQIVWKYFSCISVMETSLS